MLGHTLSPVRQVFERIPSASAAADAESRFQHFKKRVWLRIKESGASGLCVFFLCCLPAFLLSHLLLFMPPSKVSNIRLPWRFRSVRLVLSHFFRSFPAFLHHFRKCVRRHIKESGAAGHFFLTLSLLIFRLHAMSSGLHGCRSFPYWSHKHGRKLSTVLQTTGAILSATQPKT